MTEPAGGKLSWPHHEEAEQGVLGAILHEPQLIAQASDMVKPADFYIERHRVIFEAMLSLYDASQVVDLVTLDAELRRRRSLRKAGSRKYLIKLMEETITVANLEHHATIIKEKSQLRSLIAITEEIASRAREDAEDTAELLDTAERGIFEVSSQTQRRAVNLLSPHVVEEVGKIERRAKQRGQFSGVCTGFRRLDELTTGFQKSDLIILAGRPSMGKTALALEILCSVAVKQKTPAVYFSLEMAAGQVVQRLVCAYGAVNSQNLRSGFVGGREWPKIYAAAKALRDAPIYIDDTPGISILELRSKARRLRERVGDLSIIFVDYIQLVTTDRHADNRQQQVSYISQSFKALARDLDIPVMVLAQLNRAVEGRKDHRPILADLRESGSIEQDADVVMFVTRPKRYLKPGTPDYDATPDTAEVVIGKQRNGPLGVVKLEFIEKYATFTDVHEGPGP